MNAISQRSGSGAPADSQVTEVLIEREQFALPAANLSILALSLLAHWFIAGSWTLWVAVHFICLGLGAVVSVYLWATPKPR